MPVDQSSNLTLRELIDEVIDERLASVHGPQPGQVLSYDEVAQTISAQPLVMRVRVDETTGETTRRPRPAVHDVPVLFWGGAGGGITHPVEEGDVVLLVPCGVNLDRWHLRGGLVDPGNVDPDRDSGRFADVVAISGLSDRRHQPRAAPTDALVVDPGAHTAKIGGATGTQRTLMADSFLDALDQLVSAIALAVGTSGTPAGATAAQTAIETAASIFAAALLRDAYKTQKTEVK